LTGKSNCSTGTPGFGGKGGTNLAGTIANDGANGTASQKLSFN
jgi:hypothetical protein